MLYSQRVHHARVEWVRQLGVCCCLICVQAAVAKFENSAVARWWLHPPVKVRAQRNHAWLILTYIFDAVSTDYM